MALTGRLQVVAVAAAAPGTSFPDRLWIWLHVAFVIFTIGPVAIAILSTPRYIKTRNVAVLRYMLRTTRIFGTASLGVLVLGIVVAHDEHEQDQGHHEQRHRRGDPRGSQLVQGLRGHDPEDEDS